MATKMMLLLISIYFTSCARYFEPPPSHETKAQEAISEWIHLNAKYPETYVSKTFESYQYILWDNKNDKNHKFYIKYKHSYILKTKAGELGNYSHYFVLDNNYLPTIIKSKPFSLLTGIPPSTFEWSNQFSDGIINVHMNGLSQQQFGTNYEDWKFLNKLDIEHEYYNYWCDGHCEDFIKDYGIENMEKFNIKRVLAVRLNDQTTLDELNLHGLGMSSDRFLLDNNVLYIVLISRKNDNSEQYCVLNTGATTNKKTLNVIGSNAKYFVN